MFQDSPPQDSNNKSPSDRFRNHDSIDKIEEARKRDEDAKARVAEERAEYSKALNAIFASDNGKFVAKHMYKYAGIEDVDSNPPDGRLAVDKGKRQFFLETIWKLLDKTTKMEILNQ